ncbi:hypothetical protein IT774_09950 [Salinimonas marina]|uniref:Glyoxalase-like domain-containing protein n=1 Tax=Salinimonas marina TaxID=2785918 RepID=A0A7S9HCK3_9ALTE|nr:hypothetical protein [Salinimonas marina]QPG04561.1 hypothetical protein IT774_09950 [Salinimonas marina]
MPTPAQNGVLIYSGNFCSLAGFYQQLFDLSIIRQTKEFISLEKDGFNLIIHIPPFSSPKESFCSIKLFLTVQDIEATKQQALELGGKIFDGEWANLVFKVANIADCDGNHIQIREFMNTGDPTQDEV